MHFEYILLTLDKSVWIQKHLHSPASHLNFCSFLHKHTPTHTPYIQPCWGQRSSPISCCPGRPAPPRTSVAVYRRRPWHLLYPLHFNTGQETDGESGDANEISPSAPILHSEWLLSSPWSYKSDGAWERRRIKRRKGREGQREMEWRRKKRNGSYGQTVLFKVVTVIGLV